MCDGHEMPGLLSVCCFSDRFAKQGMIAQAMLLVRCTFNSPRSRHLTHTGNCGVSDGAL